MTRLTINGQERELPAPATVASALAALDLPGGGRGIAVAVDGEVVPSSGWDRHELHDGAQVEVLRAIQGG